MEYGIHNKIMLYIYTYISCFYIRYISTLFARSHIVSKINIFLLPCWNTKDFNSFRIACIFPDLPNIGVFEAAKPVDLFMKLLKWDKKKYNPLDQDEPGKVLQDAT